MLGPLVDTWANTNLYFAYVLDSSGLVCVLTSKLGLRVAPTVWPTSIGGIVNANYSSLGQSPAHSTFCIATFGSLAYSSLPLALSLMF